MKFFFSILFIAFLGIGMNAQTMIGARGQVSNTWMFNKNLSDNGDLVDYKGTFTGGGGISVIQYLNETVGVEVGLGVNTVAQRTQGEFETFFGDDIDYVYETSVDYLEITALFKALSDGGSYFEVGPMIMLNQSETENVIDISDPDLEDDIFGTQTQRDNRVAEDFSKTLLFGVIGFGVNFDVADNLMAGVGLRLAYSFSDSVEQVTEDQYNEGDPDLGWYSTIAHTDAPLDEGEYDPVTTNAAIAGLNIALYYTIGGN